MIGLTIGSLLIGLGRFAFGSVPARLNDPFVWYITVSHFWVGALLLVCCSHRFERRERIFAFACLVALTALEVACALMMKPK
jgi:hypothetical protein